MTRSIHYSTVFQRNFGRILRSTNSNTRQGLSAASPLFSSSLSYCSPSTYAPTMESFRTQTSEQFTQRINQYYDLKETEKDVFTTSNLLTNRQASVKAAFGGLIFSQAMAAAEQTVGEHFKPHAMHSFFILNVDTRVPVDYTVRRIRDGRSFCTRTVEAVQDGKVAFCLEVSFHVQEPDTIVHQSRMPDVPAPEDCVSTKEFADRVLEQVEKGEVTVSEMQLKRLKYESVRDATGDLFDIRSTAPSEAVGLHEGLLDRTTCYWMRTQLPVLSDCEKLHRYLVAFTSDSTLAGTAMKPHLANDFRFSMMFSLDHNLWFHEDKVRADEWVLYECHSTKAGRSRAFIEARLWSRNGTLLMSATQEALIRSKGAYSKL